MQRKLPAAAARIELADQNGNRQRPLDAGKNKASVVIFVLQDCPISNKYAPEIQRLAADFGEKDIRFFLVHVDPELTDDEARQHATDYEYDLPVLVDRQHQLVKALAATTAPEAFVIAPDRTLLYRGRIDDRYVSIGKPRHEVRRRDLRLALEAIADGKPVEVAETDPVGCHIPERE